MSILATLAGLFAIAFAAATIFPAQSEAAVVAALVSGTVPAWAAIAVASLGNTLGAIVNYAIGRGAERLKHRRWFPVSPAALDRASRWYRRWGRWSLLLSWAPLGGDALTVAAGVMREPVWSFVLLVAVAKTTRYLVLAALTFGWLGR